MFPPAHSQLQALDGEKTLTVTRTKNMQIKYLLQCDSTVQMPIANFLKRMEKDLREMTNCEDTKIRIRASLIHGRNEGGKLVSGKFYSKEPEGKGEEVLHKKITELVFLPLVLRDS
jgi:hypothetical protein